MGPLQTALSLGLQYPPLAQAALSALERWELEQPTAIQAVAPQIVPLLDPYLLEIKDLAAAADASSPEGVPHYWGWLHMLQVSAALVGEYRKASWRARLQWICKHLQHQEAVFEYLLQLCSCSKHSNVCSTYVGSYSVASPTRITLQAATLLLYGNRRPLCLSIVQYKSPSHRAY